jgi:hypothetical protein
MAHSKAFNDLESDSDSNIKTDSDIKPFKNGFIAFRLNYTTAILMSNACTCKMCPSCLLHNKFMHVQDGALFFQKGSDLKIVPSEYMDLVIFGYIFASLLYDTLEILSYDSIISDELRKELFMKTLEFEGCNTLSCEDFVREWLIVEEGVTLFENGETLPEMPSQEDHEDLHTNFELKSFGYNWAEASSPDYNWQEKFIEPGMIEVTRLIEEMRLKKAQEALAHDDDDEDDDDDDDDN